MEKIYQTPSIEIVAFRPLNVIATSNDGPTLQNGYSDTRQENLAGERGSNPIWD